MLVPSRKAVLTPVIFALCSREQRQPRVSLYANPGGCVIALRLEQRRPGTVAAALHTFLLCRLRHRSPARALSSHASPHNTLSASQQAILSTVHRSAPGSWLQATCVKILGFVMAQKPADRVRMPCFDLCGDAAGLAVALPQEKAGAYTAFMWARLEELPPVPPKQRMVVPLFFAYAQRDRFLGGVRAMVGVTNATGADGRPVALFDVCVQTVAGDMSGQSAPPLVRVAC